MGQYRFEAAGPAGTLGACEVALIADPLYGTGVANEVCEGAVYSVFGRTFATPDGGVLERRDGAIVVTDGLHQLDIGGIVLEGRQVEVVVSVRRDDALVDTWHFGSPTLGLASQPDCALWIVSASGS
jgi:hypothetical protein